MVLCNKNAIIWARDSMWGETALFTGRLTGLHCHWWLWDPFSLSSGGPRWHPVHILSSRRYRSNSTVMIFPLLLGKTAADPYFHCVFIASGMSLLPTLGNSDKIWTIWEYLVGANKLILKPDFWEKGGLPCFKNCCIKMNSPLIFLWVIALSRQWTAVK